MVATSYTGANANTGQAFNWLCCAEGGILLCSLISRPRLVLAVAQHERQQYILDIAENLR